MISHALQLHSSLMGVRSDAGYRGCFAEFATLLGLNGDISERITPVWNIIPKRWRIERSFAWIGNFRWLSKDYEISTLSEGSHVHISYAALLLRRLL